MKRAANREQDRIDLENLRLYYPEENQRTQRKRQR